MAVHPPTGPFPPNDGSNIFRRGMPKPKPVPPADDARTPSPPEPAEPLDLDDEDALFGTAGTSPIDDLDAALSGVMLEPADDDPLGSAILLDADALVPDGSGELFGDSGVGIHDSGVLLDESLTDFPAADPAEGQDDALADTRAPVPPSAADSSIFTGGPLTPTDIGSGWLDASASAARKGEPTSGDLWAGGMPTDLPPPVKPPSTHKYDDAANLFADLRGDNPPSDSMWVEAADPNAENTGRVSDSEVRRVFDTTREPAPAGSMAEFDLTAEESGLIGGKGDAIEFDDHLSDPDAGGSSIFDRNLPVTEIVTDADNVDFDIPVPGDQSPASSMSGRMPDVDADPEAVAADLFGRDMGWVDDSPDAEVAPADATDDRAPAIAAAVAAGALGGVGAAPPARDKRTPGSTGQPKDRQRASAKVPPPPKRAVADDDDKPEPKGKKGGGIGSVLAGLATGLALGVGGFAIVYMTGLIPNEKKVASVTPGGDPQAAAKVEKLTADLEAANEKVANAATDLKQMKDGVTRRQAALDEANAKADQLETDLTAAKKDATDAKKAATDAKNATAAALASVDPLKKDLDAAKKLAADATKEVDAAKQAATDAMKDVDAAKKVATNAMKDLDGAKKLAADAVKERDDAKTALDTAKKDAEDKTKLYTDAGMKLAAAEAKLKTADDAVAGVVKELKANKLLDDKDDASKLPDAIKKLAAVASSGDAKKAAEALIAALKERDDAKAAMTKAETDAKAALAKADADTKAALTAATKAKTDADKLVADVMKAADEKVKTAADEATKDLKKQLTDATAVAKKAQDDLTAAKATAKADAEAAMKAKLDDATAKATAAEKALDTKVKAMEADFAAKIAEARSGVMKLVPAEMEASEKAGRNYADGVDAYRRRAFTDAEALFTAATAGQPADARYWYYLGLARTQTGTAGAAEAFKKGAEMEARNKPSGKVIDAALERLAFADKERVNKYRR